MHPQTTEQPAVPDGASTTSYTLRDLLLYFLRLGTLGFGGPIALAGHMQKWIQGMFYGIGAAVIAIIARSAIKLVPILAAGAVGILLHGTAG